MQMGLALGKGGVAGQRGESSEGGKGSRVLRTLSWVCVPPSGTLPFE